MSCYDPDETTEGWTDQHVRQGFTNAVSGGLTTHVPGSVPIGPAIPTMPDSMIHVGPVPAVHPHEIAEPKPLPHGTIRVTREAEMSADGSVMSLYRLEITNIKTKSAQQVLLNVLPRVLTLFLEKNQDYGDDMGAMRLGPKGQFVDIWRKVGKLKRSLWDGERMVGEQSDEMLMDLIGHILLALGDMWRKD